MPATAVLSTWTDNSGCPSYTDFTVPELEAQIADAWSFVTETSCTIDGVPISGLGDPQTTPFLIQASVFSYTVASHDNLLAGVYGETCIPDGTTVSPAVALGVCVMLAPLSPGHHTIHFVGIVGPVSSPFVEIDVTYNINVVAGLVPPPPLNDSHTFSQVVGSSADGMKLAAVAGVIPHQRSGPGS